MAAQQRRYATPTEIQFCSDDDEEEVEEEQCTRSSSLVASDDEYADSCSTRKRSRSASSAKANRSSVVAGRVWNEKEEITLLGHLIAKVPREKINFLFPNKEKEQIRRKIRHLKEKFQKHKDGAKFINLHQEKLYDLSNKVWGENTTTTTTTTSSDKEGGQEKDSMNVDDDVVGDEEDTVEINDDVILMGLDEYLARRSLHNISEELRRKLESKWRRLAYERARYGLAVSEFAIKLQHYKLRYYNNC
ncbi:PREDICTED: uncharacterized protein LOC101310359 [Fragaria vesca subsp. vesca]|uniref:uncharacterized protein LOC101310359 n=1 Tax=Fragaria vesca subsp. vesca TaxID=101020 RepID=UPI0002C3222C|nr:PREDICTED: uncharacterized protein LOC101310359 [Fragaria vesca subsp. vesca]